ncbi:MAG TPA: LuxR C-terminal-related transcriptional regulator [Jatrophihabitans sp.]|nr:LuxR C-terminal-related transcriptional regulator [Jatrophihabitans sp.]
MTSISRGTHGGGDEPTAAESVATEQPEAEPSAVAGSRYEIPPPPEHLVLRPNLMALLDRGAEYALTLVSAPAGTGKTVAVSTWARARRTARPIVWMMLSGLDLRVGVPWGRVAEELARSGVEFDAAAEGEPVSIAGLADGIARHHTAVTVILDCAVDLSHIDAARLEQLLSDSMGRLRLVLLTRTDPLLPLHRYRLQQTVAEIRMADLAFTAEETRDLFARRGVQLSGDQLGLIVSRSRGWAAGLVLTALALAAPADRGQVIRQFRGSSGSVADYLLAEVLDAQSPRIRSLLLRTSVAEILRPGLIDALAGAGGGAALAELMRGNAFVERVPGHPTWYRYHPLFRELLRAELSYEDPDEVQRLHLVAADWLARVGQIAEAVQTAVDADLWSVAAGYVVEQLAIADLLTPAPTVLRQLLAPIPAETGGSAVALVRAALAVSDGRLDDAALELRRADPRAGTPTPVAVVSALVVAAVRASLTDDADDALAATATAERALIAAGPRALSSRPELEIVLDTAQARARLATGRLAEAAAACTQVVTGGLRVGFEWAHIECLGYLALIAGWRGENRKAVRLARQALALQDRPTSPQAGAQSVTEAALAWVYVETGDRARARRHAAAASAETATGSSSALAVTLALIESRLRRAQGDLHGARAPLGECRRLHRLPDWWVGQIAADEAVISALEGQRSGADGAGPATPGAAPAPGLPGTLPAQVGLLLAEAHERVGRGEEDAAVESLERALRLSAPERLRRPFREAPPDVRLMLRSQRDIAQRHGWLEADAHRVGRAAVSERSSDPADPTAPELVVPELLTAKEREVLGYLAQLLTTEEIAGAMFVSVNTIRTHVRNVLRKLGASRRNQAIRRARELGILDA